MSDTGARSAAEAAVLRRIAVRFSPEDPARLISVIQNAHRIARSSDPEFSAMMAEYYALRDARLASQSTTAAATAAALARSEVLGRLPLIVAQTAQPLADGAKALVLRRAHGPKRAVIVLGPDADVVVLGSAIAMLKRQRAADHDAVDQDERTVLSSVGVQKLGPRLRAGLESELAALRSAKWQHLPELQGIPGVGVVRALNRVVPASKRSLTR